MYVCRLLSLTLAGWFLLISTDRVRAQSAMHFVDQTADSGIDFQHVDGGSGARYIVEYISAGVAALDFDGDGLTDLYFLNGGALPGSHHNPTPTNRLYKNLGGFRFQDVTSQAGVGDDGHGLGVAAADVDGDGDQDLFVNNFGPNVLYLNQGDGTFAVSPDNDKLKCAERVGAGVSFLDIDADGVVDLFVANYVDFSFESPVTRQFRGHSIYPSPQDFAPVADRLFHGQGDGNFKDISQSSGLSDVAGTGMGCLVTDFDKDGDSDIFVCNDVMANFLLENDGSGNFAEIGLLSGAAFDFAGVPQGSMGVAGGDVDLDGHVDLLVTSYQEEAAVLYRNSGAGYFEDLTVKAGELRHTVPDVTWGVGLCDFDLDGDLDAFMASGHLMDNVSQTDDTQTYAARNFVFENDGQGSFTNVTDQAGPGLDSIAVSRGTVQTDLDNDGDIDVVVLNSNASPRLLENRTQANHHWLQLELHGTSATRDGLGAAVTVVAGDFHLVQEVYSGSGYQSHSGRRLCFGLGDETGSVTVDVRWLDAPAERFENLPVDQLHVLIQGQGTPAQ